MSCSGIPLIEPIAVTDDFISGVDHIESVEGDCARFVLYVASPSLANGGMERIVVRKIVIPHKCLGKAIGKALRYAALHSIEIAGTKIIKVFQGQGVH